MPSLPKSSFAVTSRHGTNVAVLTVTGDVDLQTAPLLAEQITAALTSRPSVVILDLRAVGFLASAGLEVLVAARRKGATVAVVADRRAVRRPIILTGLDRHIPLYTSLNNALDELDASHVAPVDNPGTPHAS